MDAIFGTEVPFAVKVLIGFLVVFGLIGLISWVVRNFGMERLTGAANRGRAPRLAVIDAASVDSRRKLVIIRRDNVEHLLMIGGPTDVVVETNIVRAAGAQRDVATPTRASTVDTLPRAVPLPDAPVSNVQWTPPEPAAPTPMPAPVASRPSARSVESLAGLAAELSAQTQAPEIEVKPSRAPTPTIEPVRAATPTPPLAPEAPNGLNGDQNLAEMAQRLEAALRRPGANGARPPDTKSKIEPMPPATASASNGAARSTFDVSRVAEVKPPMPAPAPAVATPGKSKTMYDSLEQEMASLLGRPKKT